MDSFILTLLPLWEHPQYCSHFYTFTLLPSQCGSNHNKNVFLTLHCSHFHLLYPVWEHPQAGCGAEGICGSVGGPSLQSHRAPVCAKVGNKILPSGGRLYDPTCVTPGVTASASASASVIYQRIFCCCCISCLIWTNEQLSLDQCCIRSRHVPRLTKSKWVGETDKTKSRNSAYSCRPGGTEEEDGVVVFACLGTDQVR